MTYLTLCGWEEIEDFSRKNGGVQWNGLEMDLDSGDGRIDYVANMSHLRF